MLMPKSQKICFMIIFDCFYFNEHQHHLISIHFLFLYTHFSIVSQKYMDMPESYNLESCRFLSFLRLLKRREN